MSKYQGSKFSITSVDEEIKKLSEIFLRVIDGTLRTIDEIILELKYSSHFRDSNRISNELFEYGNFTDEQIKEIAKIYIDNYQVRISWTAGDVITKFLHDKKDLIYSKFPELIGQLKEFGASI